MTEELERFRPDLRGRIAYEHFHRYALCASLVAGCRVLDIASGEGYGSAFLARSATSVCGLDVDHGAVNAARKKYGSVQNLRFVQGDGLSLPFEDGSFDVVVSFETIEHLFEGERFLAEIRRVLAPDGQLVVSTPDRDVYDAAHVAPNKFHLREYSADEFTKILSDNFTHVVLHGQRFYLGSFIVPLSADERQTNADVYHGLVADRSEAGALASRPGIVDGRGAQYLLAFCSDRQPTLPQEATSVYIDRSDDLWAESEKVLVWASGVHEEDERLRAELAARRAERVELDRRLAVETGHADAVEGLLARAKETIDLLEAEVEAATRRLDRSRRETEALRAELEAAGNAAPLAETAMRDRRPAIDADLESLRQLYEARLKSVMDEARDERVRRMDDLSEARRRIGELEDALFASRAGERTATERLRQVEDEADENIRDLRAQFDRSAEEEAARFDAELDRARRDADAAIQEREALAAHAAELEAERRAALDDAERARVDALEQIASATAQAERLRREAEATNRRVGSLEDLLRKARSATASEQARRRAEAAEASERIARLSVLGEITGMVAANRRDASTVAEAAVGTAPIDFAPDGGPKVSGGLGRLRLAARRRRLAAALLDRNLFAAEWYAARHRLRSGVAGALDHFLSVGLAAGHDPHPLFCGAWYVARLGRPLPRGTTAIEHYLERTDPAGGDVHPLFDRAYYLDLYPDVRATGCDPLVHYVSSGAMEGRRPHPAFDAEWFGADDPTAAHGGLVGYLADPDLWRRSPHPLFDAAWYVDTHRRILPADVNPLLHHVTQGWRLGCNPHRFFDGRWYEAHCPDAAASGEAPLVHWIRHAERPLAAPHPLFDPDWYLREYPDVCAAGRDPLVHFVTAGLAEGRRPNGLGAFATFYETIPEARGMIPALFEGNVSFSSVERSLEPSRAATPTVAAPPARSPDAPREYYWLPQALRDYIVDRFGEDEVEYVRRSMELVERWGESSANFAETIEYADLLDRIRSKASALDTSEPEVTIVVPAHDGLVYTMTSIASVLAAPTRWRYEIIVADDCSKDGTAEAAAAMGGNVVHLRRQANLGFLLNCNEAVEHARGRFVVLLNNDTIVLPGWLDQLLQPFEDDERIGFVGSKLINGDGTLQEAGGIYWSDGSAWNYGRGGNPRAPEFNYLKDVDYCSGASIAMPTDLWRRLGGFDTLFLPAYCEDSDLAFRVREAGWRTVYQPKSEVIHHEGRSHGRDTSVGIKAHQVVNQQKLLDRWRETLERDHFPNGEEVFVARDRSRRAPHIVIVDHYVPQWDRDAGSRSTYHYVRLFLAHGFHVTLWPDNLHEDRTYSAALQSMGVEVIYSHLYSGKFADWIADNGKWIDYVLLSRPHISIKYIDDVKRCFAGKIIYYGHDIHWERLEKEYAVSRAAHLPAEIDRVRSQELQLWEAADVVLYPSEAEIDTVLRTVGPAKAAAAIPVIIFDPAEVAGARARSAEDSGGDPYRLLFVGGFSHGPNADGVVWFVEDVLPRLTTRDPRWHLDVVGSNAPPEILRLAGADVSILGRVDDAELARLYREAGIVIAPLRFGGGVKGKVVEAFVNARPLVTTSIGMQGIPGGERLVSRADDAEAFATAIEEIVTNPSRARERVAAALDFVEQFYSMQAACRALEAHIGELRTPPPRSAG